MARLLTVGFESGHQQSEGGTFGGSPTFDTGTVRSGARSMKCAAGSTYFQWSQTATLGRVYYFRFAFRIPAQIAAAAGTIRLISLIQGAAPPMSIALVDGTNVLRLLDTSLATVADGTTAIQANTWYTVEVKVMVPAAGQGYAEVRLNGAVEIAQTNYTTGNTAWVQARLGVCAGSIGGLSGVFVDDIAVNDDQGSDQNGYPGEGRVFLLVPAADPGTGTSQGNWTKPGGTNTGRHTSVDNAPPIYIADSTASGDAEKMLRNPTNAASQLELDVTDYTAAGVPADSTIKLVVPVAGTGSSSATDTGGDFGVLSNPTGSQKTMTTFDNGVASTTATTWPTFFADPIYTPTPTRGTKPRLRLNRNATARTVMTNFMGLLVEFAFLGAAALTGTGSLSATAVVTRFVAVDDTVTPSDAQAFARGLAVADTVTPDDAQTFARGLTLADTVTPDDAQALSRGLAIADTVTPDDAQTFSRGVEVDDTVTLSDAQTFDRGLTLDDTVTLSDNTAAVNEISVAVDDTVAVDDAQTFARGLAIDDTVTLTDDVSVPQDVSLTIDDTVTLSDAQTFARGVQVDDTVSLSDLLLAEVGFTVAIADTVTLSDLVTTGAAEAIGVPDAGHIGYTLRGSIGASRNGRISTTEEGVIVRP